MGLSATVPSAPGRSIAASSYARHVHVICWWAAILAFVPGFAMGIPWLLALSAGSAGIALTLSDVIRIRSGGVSAITVYSLSAAAIGFANMVGLLSVGGAKESLYFLYASPDHLVLAMLLALAGTVLPVVGFRLAVHPMGRAFYHWLPEISGRIGVRDLMRYGGLLAVGVLVSRLMLPLPSLGTLTAIFLMAPQLVAFSLARAGAELRVAAALTFALIIGVADSIYALFYQFLRADVAAPLAAVILGALFGARSLSVLRRKIFIPIHAAFVVFALYFGAFAAARTSGGVQRIVSAQEHYVRIERGEVGPSAARQTVGSRLTTFNQLSQIGRVVAEDGFLNGKTLEYMGFALIPRFLWPEKPAIAKGQWWALRIGQANVRFDGTITNSVNMTIPGELYLNFGWPGVLLGCLLFGMFVGVLWNRARFWDGATNVLGSAFGFYLLWVWIALSLGPDLQVLVTMLAMYMLFVGAGAALRSLGQTSRTTDLPSPRRSRVT